MKHTKRRLAIIATSTAAVLLGAGVAVAYWTSTGSGTGTAGVGTTSGVSVNQTAPAPTGLYPGGPAQGITFVVHSTNAAAVTISAVNVGIDGTTLPTGCTAGDFTITQPAGTTATPVTSAADVASSAWGTYTIAMKNAVTNQDACKSANVGLTFSAS
jgi:hypothetical protein